MSKTEARSTTSANERVAFEAWAKERGYQSDELDRSTLGLVGPEYFNLNTEMAWQAWLAGAARFAPNLEAAAMKLAEVFDYPWEYMPAEGRQNMRKNAEAVLNAAGVK